MLKICYIINSVRKAELHSRYKTYKNLLVKLTRKSKDSHYKKFFEVNKLNALKVWQGIKSLINVKKSNKKTIKSLSVDNKLLTNNNDISIEFNSFFNTMLQR